MTTKTEIAVAPDSSPSLVDERAKKEEGSTAYHLTLTHPFSVEGEITERSKNSDFVMLYRHNKEALITLGLKDPKARVLLDFLIMHMDNENSLIVSREALAELLKWSVRTVSYKVKVLIKNQFIDIFKSGTSNVYCVNANIAWSTYANKRDYAKFRATVLISKSEQEDKVRIMEKTRAKLMRHIQTTPKARET